MPSRLNDHKGAGKLINRVNREYPAQFLMYRI